MGVEVSALEDRVRHDLGVHAGRVLDAADRPAALRRSLRALNELKVDGIKTTAGMHARIVAHPVFMSGDFDTHFIEKTGLLAKKEPTHA